jgi:hypothetical protein
MRAWVPSGSRARRASSPFDRALSGRATHLRVALPLVKPGGFRKFGIKLGKVSGKSETVAREHKLRRFCFWLNHRNGAAQESNLPSVGLRRRTGFEGLPGEGQLATETPFCGCFSALRSC